ncbi:hypothetical protein [Desulfomonile tiedjei]|uniref:Uncharacterized protein n=1 Tax=Desulfomonile tiedjei (strain ATCC 49306 / DSM 6799 / DCB-1) TaxID=706587 RepID=I4C4K1_DESTA|nr:hypothetical protein [Desulfomonile tiedjei]AFM24492.1 hypothetical protein Desti_1783 [Desulfomonile tiedjei DSM 6799]
MAKRKIRAKDMVHDIREGLSDSQLIEKYGLTSRGLQYIFRKLVQTGLMTDLEFFERSKLTESEVFRAFSDHSSEVIKCPNCGQALSEQGDECIFCQTIDVTKGACLASDVSGEAEVASSNRSRPRIEK